MISMLKLYGVLQAVANLVLNGDYKRIGISPPEYLGEHYKFVRDYLAMIFCLRLPIVPKPPKPL